MNREELLKALDEALDEGDVDLAKALSKKLKTMPDDGSVTTKTRKPRGQSTNIQWNQTWVDDGQECAEERLVNKKVKQVGNKLVDENNVCVALQVKTGQRPAYEEIEVVCRDCSKKFMVNPLIGTQSHDPKGATYRCNSCIAGS